MFKFLAVAWYRRAANGTIIIIINYELITEVACMACNEASQTKLLDDNDVTLLTTASSLHMYMPYMLYCKKLGPRSSNSLCNIAFTYSTNEFTSIKPACRKRRRQSIRTAPTSKSNIIRQRKFHFAVRLKYVPFKIAVGFILHSVHRDILKRFFFSQRRIAEPIGVVYSPQHKLGQHHLGDFPAPSL